MCSEASRRAQKIYRLEKTRKKLADVPISTEEKISDLYNRGVYEMLSKTSPVRIQHVVPGNVLHMAASRGTPQSKNWSLLDGGKAYTKIDLRGEDVTITQVTNKPTYTIVEGTFQSFSGRSGKNVTRTVRKKFPKGTTFRILQ